MKEVQFSEIAGLPENKIGAACQSVELDGVREGRKEDL